MSLSIVGRMGSDPRMRESMTELTCSDIFELSDGRFAVIGADLTDELDGCLPEDAARGGAGRIVVISRRTLIDAWPDIFALPDLDVNARRGPAVLEALVLMLSVACHELEMLRDGGEDGR